MVKDIHILKSDVFAIRGKNWLFEIIEKPNILSSEYIDYNADILAEKLEEEHIKSLSKWKRFFYKSDKHKWKGEAILTKEIGDLWKEKRQQETQAWNSARSKYILVKQIDAGSFGDHKIIIKDKETGIMYFGFCNNHGKNNTFLTFKHYEE